MGEVIAMKQQKFIVARGAHSAAPYLALEENTYRWIRDVKRALQFSDEKEAEEVAQRVAGGATVAELVAV